MTIPKTSLSRYKFSELQAMLPEIENKKELIAELKKDIERNQSKLKGFENFFTAQHQGVEYINKDLNDRIMGSIKKNEWLIFMMECPEMYNELYPVRTRKKKVK